MIMKRDVPIKLRQMLLKQSTVKIVMTRSAAGRSIHFEEDEEDSDKDEPPPKKASR
jgi:hypothetical protein